MARRHAFLLVDSPHTVDGHAISGGAMSQRVALVTGGSSGIGLEVGRQLRAAGYAVVLTARRSDILQQSAESIGASWSAGDASDPESFVRVVASVNEEFGRIDLVVHAAGTMGGTFVRKETLEEFNRILAINLSSAFVVANSALPYMGSGAKFIFVSSSSSHQPHPGRSAYSASKAGLNAFAAAFAKEVERDGIGVHVLTVGPVRTPMIEDVRFPMHTLGVEEVAAAIVWLDTIPGNVRLPEVQLSSVEDGPMAPELFVPEAAKKLGRS